MSDANNNYVTWPHFVTIGLATMTVICGAFLYITTQTIQIEITQLEKALSKSLKDDITSQFESWYGKKRTK